MAWVAPSVSKYFYYIQHHHVAQAEKKKLCACVAIASLISRTPVLNILYKNWSQGRP